MAQVCPKLLGFARKRYELGVMSSAQVASLRQARDVLSK
jgi:hypothetical protein